MKSTQRSWHDTNIQKCLYLLSLSDKYSMEMY